jgi:hypothetical protein
MEGRSGGLSDTDLLREVARRRLAKGNFDIDAIEELAGAAQRDLGEETLAAVRCRPKMTSPRHARSASSWCR